MQSGLSMVQLQELDKEKGKSSDPEGISTPTQLDRQREGCGTDEATGAPSEQPSSPGRKYQNNEKFWAWATVVSATLIQMSGFGYSNAFGVFQDFYVREFLTSSTSSQISWIGSTQTFLMLSMSVITGRLFDRGYCYHLIISGAIIFVVSLFMLSLARPEQYYQVFLAQGVGAGIGAGLSYAPSLAVLAQHFTSPHARARAMGIAVAGSSIGGLVHPILLNSLFYQESSEGLDGIRRAFARGTRASAGLIAGLLSIAVLLMRAKYPKTEDPDPSKNRKEKDDQGKKPIRFIHMIKKFASDWPYVFFVIGMILYEMVFFFPSFYLQLDAITRRLDPTFAFYSLSILNGASFIGRLVPGFLARRLGVANMFVLSTMAAAVLMFCMLAVQTVADVAIFAILYGFFSGSFITLMAPMLALLAESTAEMGTRMGICFAFSGLGSLIGTPISGALLTSRFIWWRPIVFNGVMCIFGSVLFTACRIVLGRRRGSFWIV